ncbi:hypothetical protein [Desulfopila inferna]|uniref:hypothetical protein n=1 Tax=Desulfopila inferna TaxID=468528 RepID=UPI001966B5FC|nr:hypothetical protein [Desulfopila inferna]MBM9603539.1 hypothetical protein [Desulfopila inferna]
MESNKEGTVEEEQRGQQVRKRSTPGKRDLPRFADVTPEKRLLSNDHTRFHENGSCRHNRLRIVTAAEAGMLAGVVGFFAFRLWVACSTAFRKNRILMSAVTAIRLGNGTSLREGGQQRQQQDNEEVYRYSFHGLRFSLVFLHVPRCGTWSQEKILPA